MTRSNESKGQFSVAVGLGFAAAGVAVLGITSYALSIKVVPEPNNCTPEKAQALQEKLQSTEYKQANWEGREAYVLAVSCPAAPSQK